MRYTTRKPPPAAGTGSYARPGPPDRGAPSARRPGHPALTQQAWRRASEWPLLAAAVLFLAAYSVQVIANLPEARWWAVATITTFGYGDFYPVTQLGRFVAAGLMIGGIAVLGIVTAAVASWLVRHVAAETAAELGAAEAPIHDELTRLTARIEELTARIDQLNSPSREHAGAEPVPPHPR